LFGSAIDAIAACESENIPATPRNRGGAAVGTPEAKGETKSAAGELPRRSFIPFELEWMATAVIDRSGLSLNRQYPSVDALWRHPILSSAGIGFVVLSLHDNVRPHVFVGPCTRYVVLLLDATSHSEGRESWALMGRVGTSGVRTLVPIPNLPDLFQALLASTALPTSSRPRDRP
jgi:hypothetical protein